LQADEAVELLAAVAASLDHEDALQDGDLDDDATFETSAPANGSGAGGTEVPMPVEQGRDGGRQPWPETCPLEDGQDRPIVVQMLGHFAISVGGEPVASGLRSRDRALFAWFLLRPEGATSDEAVDALERAIELDRYAEEPYRRLMALHAARGRLDSVTATWHLLGGRLGDLDLDVEAATATLYRRLTTEATTPIARADRARLGTLGRSW